MAANPIPTQLEALETLAEDAADGAHLYEVAIGLKQNMEAAIHADLTDFQTKNEAHKTAQGGKAALTTAVQTADSNGKAFIGTARDVLAPSLGSQWSQTWEPTGFPNQSLGVPRTQAERQALLAALRDYFTANPTKENAPLGITAANATTRFNALSDARSAFNAGATDIGQKKNLRDLAATKLTKRLRGLVDELGQLLDDLDPRWLAFGLNQPGASETPDQVELLVVTPGPPGTLFADWADTPRATRYHVEILIVGIDTNFRRVQTVTESDATLAGLQSGRTVRIRIIAVNDAGSGPPSDVVETVVP